MNENNQVEIQGVTLHLSQPTTQISEWIGQNHTLAQLRACWTKLDENDWPLSPRLIGPPGLGKTSLAMAAAKETGRPVFVMQCTSDTRPEDLIITPVLNAEGKISYHASPLLSAVITGGVAILDEGNRMSEKSWASLAGLLDHRRTVESIVAGITLQAHSEFRCCVTMNDDSSTFEIPDYIQSRIQPSIELPFPERAEEEEILKYNVPQARDEVLELCLDFLQQSHHLDLPYSIRDGINLLRYSLRLLQQDGMDRDAVFKQALKQILGEEALDLEKLALQRQQMAGQMPAMNFEELFFGEGSAEFDDDEDDDEFYHPGEGEDPIPGR